MPTGNKQNDPNESTIAPSLDRRRMLKLTAVSGMAGLAGCSSDSQTKTEGNRSDSQTKQNDSQTQQQQQQELPTIGGTFTFAARAAPSSLNPLQIGETTTATCVGMMFDGGLDYRSGNYLENPDSWYKPFWIESWDISDSLDTVTVKLRENLQYGDTWGQLTAEDYIYNIENLFKSDWYPYVFQSWFYVGGQSKEPVKFEKQGKYTIREELPERRPFWPYNDPLQRVIPLPKKLLKPYVQKKDPESLNKDPAVFKGMFNGNLGPWNLKNWNRQSVLTFERAENYYLRDVAKKDDRLDDRWAEAPYYRTFNWQIFNARSTARSALKTGQVDQARISPSKIENFQGLSDVQVWENPYVSYSQFTGMNQRVNGWVPLRNRKVRYAMANLFNRNLVVETILSGNGSTQGTLYPQWGQYYPDESVKRFDWTVEKAKQLLTEGTPSEYGYSGDTFVDGSGKQVELSIISGKNPLDSARAAYLKSRLAKAGIKLNRSTTTVPGLLQDFFTTKFRAKGVPKDEPIGYGPKGNQHPSRYNWGPWDKAVSKRPWDLMLTLGFGYDPLDPAGIVKMIFGEKATFNGYGYVPSFELVQLVNKAKVAKSKEKAEDLIRKVLLELSEDQPVVFESNPYNFSGLDKNVQGLPESPADDYFVEMGANKKWAWLYNKQ